MANPYDQRYASTASYWGLRPSLICWRIDYCTEEIFDCMSSGVPHQHAVNRIIAHQELARA